MRRSVARAARNPNRIRYIAVRGELLGPDQGPTRISGRCERAVRQGPKTADTAERVRGFTVGIQHQGR